eukprot:6192222-Pyramimonas_sp.AAC.1
MQYAEVSEEWLHCVGEITVLYADVVQPSLNNSFAWLQCQQCCQAVAMLAEVSGPGWISYSGEDLAAMFRAGRPPRDLFRPLEQKTHIG